MESVMWQTISTVISIVLATALVMSALILLWKGYKSRRVKAGAFFMLAGAIWLASYKLELESVTFSAKMVWTKMQYIGITLIPPAFLVYTMEYTGHGKWVNRRNLILLTITPVIMLVLVFTNEFHGLVWSTAELVGDHPAELDKTFSTGYWAYIAYAYILILIGTILFVQMLRRGHHVYHWQVGILLIVIVCVWLASVLEVTEVVPFEHIDLTALGIAVAGLIIALNLVYLRMADIMPVARGAVIDSMRDGVIVLDAENHIVDINPAAKQLMNSAAKIVGQPIETVLPSWSDIHQNGTDTEIVINHNNENRTYDVTISQLTDWRGHIISRVVVLHDITDHVSLKEKEVLLQEIHHRVKNNLQIVSSLLSLQSTYIKDKKYAEMLKDSQNRIRSMALIHEKLYHSENLAYIDFDAYVKELVYGLIHLYKVDTITVKIEVEDILLDINTAIPCGLIINELVSNAIKHAFPDGEGEIVIHFRSFNGAIQLLVSDNGIGIPDTINFRATESLGLHLVTILAEDQLEGGIVLDRGTGTAFQITFEQDVS